jgi:hypothetical protein
MTTEKVVREEAVWSRWWRRSSGRWWHGPHGRGGGPGNGGMDRTVNEEKRRRRLRLVVALVEPSSYTNAVAMAGQMGSQRCGHGSGGDDQANMEVVVWTRRWWRRWCGLGDVKEGTGKFVTLTASK